MEAIRQQIYKGRQIVISQDGRLYFGQVDGRMVIRGVSSPTGALEACREEVDEIQRPASARENSVNAKMSVAEATDAAVMKRLSKLAQSIGQKVKSVSYGGKTIAIHKDASNTEEYLGVIDGKVVCSYGDIESCVEACEEEVDKGSKRLANDNGDLKVKIAAATAELKRACDTAVQQIAKKYGGQTTQGYSSAYSTECEYSVGITWE